jgi:putative Mg2+ transporter-C (MgtC) family protein
MNWMDFAMRMFAALFLGGAIGLERQWRQRMTGLRANGLTRWVPRWQPGQSRAYVVSGIGFLGGGLILKDGFNIRGMNTAAILWYTAAVGTLAGLGRFGFAVVGTLGVLTANLILRPVAYRINRSPIEEEEHEILYRNVGRTSLVLMAPAQRGKRPEDTSIPAADELVRTTWFPGRFTFL